MKIILHRFLAALSTVLFMGFLGGCANPHSSQSTGRSTPPPPSYVQDSFGILQGDYALYPAYQIYHSARRKNFVYLRSGSWVTRSTTPPGITESELLASPAVRLGSGIAPIFQQ